MKALLKGFINLLYPLYCQSCRVPLHPESEHVLCEKCLAGIPYNIAPFCPKCGKSFPDASGPLPSRCSGCSGKNLHFDSVLAACRYEGIIKDCIHLLKYKRRAMLGRTLADILLSFAGKHRAFTGEEIVVPVPLHTSKLREREFNQSRLFAVPLAKRFSLRLLTGNLIRYRRTASQSALTREERARNVKNAFRVKRPDGFKNKRIILVDDVLTTGATVSECSRALRAAGAAEVSVLTLARGD